MQPYKESFGEGAHDLLVEWRIWTVVDVHVVLMQMHNCMISPSMHKFIYTIARVHYLDLDDPLSVLALHIRQENILTKLVCLGLD